MSYVFITLSNQGNHVFLIMFIIYNVRFDWHDPNHGLTTKVKAWKEELIWKMFWDLDTFPTLLNGFSHFGD